MQSSRRCANSGGFARRRRMPSVRPRNSNGLNGRRQPGRGSHADHDSLDRSVLTEKVSSASHNNSSLPSSPARITGSPGIPAVFTCDPEFLHRTGLRFLHASLRRRARSGLLAPDGMPRLSAGQGMPRLCRYCLLGLTSLNRNVRRCRCSKRERCGGSRVHAEDNDHGRPLSH